MFFGSTFDNDISRWNVSKVTDMSFMFYHADFNQDISNWDISNVIDMKEMFSDSKFNSDLSSWNITKKCDTTLMFDNCHICAKYYPNFILFESFNFDAVGKEKKAINAFPIML
jgi:surface protein